MCRFTEAVCIIRGVPRRIDYHNRRCRRTREAFFPGCKHIDLEDVLRSHRGVKESAHREGKHKCRIEYGEDIYRIDIAPYLPRKIGSLCLIRDDSADYSYKYADRSGLQALEGQKGEADAVIIVRNGKITDTTFSNIAFYDGKNWIVPDTYLLAGTMRAWLLDTGKVTEQTLRAEDIRHFQSLSLINAMLDLEEGVLPVNSILNLPV